MASKENDGNAIWEQGPGKGPVRAWVMVAADAWI